jgi:hypothetical protein
LSSKITFKRLFRNSFRYRDDSLMATCVQGTWAFHELARIEALPKADLILEVHNVMNGHTYSWKSIQKVLQDRDVDSGCSLFKSGT